MSHRNLTTVLSLVAVALIGSTIASPASANAGHHNVSGSYYSDTGSAARDTRTNPTCYTEPSGFHSSIHWDNACHNVQKSEHISSDNVEIANPSFVEPSGFHHNVRSR